MDNHMNLKEFQLNEIRALFTQEEDEQALDLAIEQLMEMRVLYQSAVKELNTKLDILNDEFKFLHEYNPIDHIKYRIKTPRSIVEKLMRKNLPISIPSAKNNIYDIAGIRVICSFIDDIYSIAEVLMRHEDLRLLEVKDYIKAPKANGYRSLHLIMEVPVFFSNKVEKVPVEIQIRTNAMNFWASLEHKMRYKYRHEAPADIYAQLKDCAEQISQLDEQMMEINRHLRSVRPPAPENPWLASSSLKP